jgi:membrane-bound toxin of toxin-antitoxin system
LRVVRFGLAPSRYLAALIICAHGAAAVAVYSVLQGWAAIALPIALSVLGLAAAWSRALLRSPAAVRAIQLGGDLPAFELASGESVSAAVGDRRYVTRYVIALPLGKPLGRTLLVTADMLGPREFRRLRLWALWNRLPSDRRNVAPAQLVS